MYACRVASHDFSQESGICNFRISNASEILDFRGRLLHIIIHESDERRSTRDRHTDRQRQTEKDRQTDRHTKIDLHRQTKTDGQTNKQTDRQTETDR